MGDVVFKYDSCVSTEVRGRRGVLLEAVEVDVSIERAAEEGSRVIDSGRCCRREKSVQVADD